jgi:hypothetical protein
LIKEEDLVSSSDKEFIQPSDKDAQGNVLVEEELTSIRMSDSHKNPNKEDSKPAAQPENEDSSLPPEQHRERLDKQYHESENIKNYLSVWPKALKNNSKNKKKNARWKLWP